MTRYYKVDPRKITFAEYRRLSPSWRKTLNVWWRKISLGPLPSGGVLIGEPTTLRDRMEEPTRLHPLVLTNLQLGVADCVALGFQKPCFYRLKEALSPRENGGAYLWHSSGETVANVIYAKVRTRENNVISFSSLQRDGRVMSTTNNPSRFNSPPEFVTERIVGGTARQLWEKHLQTLAKAGKAWLAFPAEDFYEEVFRRVTRRIFDFNVQRGLWVELTPEEIAEETEKWRQARKERLTG